MMADKYSISDLIAMSKEELIELVISQMADLNDGQLEHGMLFDLIKRYAEMSKTLEATLVEVERLSNTDPLTGLNNRLSFNNAFEQEYARFLRNSIPFSLIMFDIDHFKRVNDTYGHNEGDKVLKAMADAIGTVIRDVDFSARWGGEEFIIIASQCHQEEATAMAERLRQAIESITFEIVDPVTASFGVSEIMDGDTLVSVTGRADTALYHSKDMGRNKVTVFSEKIKLIKDSPIEHSLDIQ